ncbi:uncharacterized protein [Onthophagus taurus]|uniref:uncharacterized protein n=1 Tax=Onthophagus taurus TaxID=166361 RepID=UPI0039BDBD0B
MNILSIIPIFGLILLQSFGSRGQKQSDAPIRYINNTFCKIPDLNQWEMKMFYEPKAYIPCETIPPLVKLEKDDEFYFLAVDTSAVQFYADSMDKISCVISNISRGINTQLPDQTMRESKPVPFDSTTRSEMIKDTVRVRCYIAEKPPRIVYENVFGAYVRYNIITRGRPLAKQPYNILMIALDSVSKYSFPKLLPKTFEYLNKINFKQLYGYTQLDNDALTNIIPILSGYSIKDAMKHFGTPLKTFFDTYEFLWHDYRKYGYATIFAEDFSNANTFNRQYKGFWSQPTDYYFRALSVASDLLNSTKLDNMPHCTGPENSAERILKLASNATGAFRNRPYFGLFWFNSFSHDDYNAPRRMDEKLKRFFQDIYPNLNKTIVFFFSDHGYDKDSITEQKYGAYESKSPFHFVYLPQIFEMSHKDLAHQFDKNRFTLVSPYDIFCTLEDILSLSGTNHFARKSKSCKHCRSLFKEISMKRNCKSIGVEEEWCICVVDEAKLRTPGNIAKDDNSKIHERSEAITTKSTAFYLFLYIFYYFLNHF